jgi:hypothetical protein
MLPTDSVLAGSLRWLDLLRRNTLSQAWALIGSDPGYRDLTRSQYFAALEWLQISGLLVETQDGLQVAESTRNLTHVDTSLTVMARALEVDPPAWLADAEALVLDPADLPQDAGNLATALQLDEADAMNAVRRAQRKVDFEARARIGAIGEIALLGILEQHWPGSTTHVAADDDTAGFDIAVTIHGATSHLEVKTTNRRGRLIIYLSRHEYETSLLDPAWRLVVVGLDDEDQAAAIATARRGTLRGRSPTDMHEATRWASAKYELGQEDLEPGLRLVAVTDRVPIDQLKTFAWMPQVV